MTSLEMTEAAIVFPLLPGKREMLTAFIAELSGARRNAHQENHAGVQWGKLVFSADAAGRSRHRVLAGAGPDGSVRRFGRFADAFCRLVPAAGIGFDRD